MNSPKDCFSRRSELTGGRVQLLGKLILTQLKSIRVQMLDGCSAPNEAAMFPGTGVEGAFEKLELLHEVGILAIS